MRSNSRGKWFLLLALTLIVTAQAVAQVKIAAKFNSAYGWVKPGETYPFFVEYSAGAAGATAVSVQVTIPPAASFVSATPNPTSGTGSAASPLTFNLGILAPNASGRILIRARAASLAEDPEVIWKNLSAGVKVTSSVAGVPQPVIDTKTMGPKVTTLETARYGERPFPVVMVQYQDIKHCTGAGAPFPECTGNHTAQALDAAVNSRTSGKSLWQLYNDMSFGQLSPIGSVRPKVGSTNAAF